MLGNGCVKDGADVGVGKECVAGDEVSADAFDVGAGVYVYLVLILEPCGELLEVGEVGVAGRILPSALCDALEPLGDGFRGELARVGDSYVITGERENAGAGVCVGFGDEFLSEFVLDVRFDLAFPVSRDEKVRMFFEGEDLGAGGLLAGGVE